MPGVALVRRSHGTVSDVRYAVPVQGRWRKLSLVVSVGAVFALGAFAFASRNDLKSSAPRDAGHAMKNSAPIASSNNSSVSIEKRPLSSLGNAGELDTLRTRNRRLEALVTVLRERAEQQKGR